MILSEVLKKYPPEKDFLIEVLIDVDKLKDDHYVSQSEISRIAEYLGAKESHVCSVISFYTLLSTEPRGKYIIQICKDVPCYLNDTFNVVETVCNFLHLEMGKTTEDKMFTVEFTACIGCCDDAPAMRINDITYTGLSKDKVITILKDYKEGKK